MNDARGAARMAERRAIRRYVPTRHYASPEVQTHLKRSAIEKRERKAAKLREIAERGGMIRSVAR